MRFKCGHSKSEKNTHIGSDGKARCLMCRRRMTRDAMRRIRDRCELAETWKFGATKVSVGSE